MFPDLHVQLLLDTLERKAQQGFYNCWKGFHDSVLQFTKYYIMHVHEGLLIFLLKGGTLHLVLIWKQNTHSTYCLRSDKNHMIPQTYDYAACDALSRVKG